MNSLIHDVNERTNLAVGLLFLLLALMFFAGVLLPPAGQVLAGHDMVGNYYIYWDLVREALRSGHLLIWEPNIFGGFPFLAQPQQSTFYPPTWVNLILPVRVGVSLYMVFHVWLASFGMFLFARAMGGRRLPSILAGLGFAYGGLLTGRLWAGHLPVYAVFIWTPLMLLALAWALDRRSWAAAVLGGVPFAMALLAGHIPSFLYVGLIWAAFIVYQLLIRGGERRHVVRSALIIAVVGFSLAAVQLVPFLQFSATSSRVAEADYEFATDYSFPPAHLMTLLVPEFFGEPLRVGYWSVPTFEELTYYAGILAVLGIILALRRPTRLTWFYLALIVFGLWLAFGRYGILYKLAYQFLPPFRLVRAPGRAAFLYLFAGSALLAHALSYWREQSAEECHRVLRRYWAAAVSVSAIGLIAALAATGAVFMAIHPTDTSGRLWQQIGGYSHALIVVGIGAALIWAYLNSEELVSKGQGMGGGRVNGVHWRTAAIGGALILLVVGDTWVFSQKMVRTAATAPDPVWVDGRALVDDPDGRVLPWGIPLFSQNGAIQVAWPSVFGYDSLEPENHIALASSVPDPRSTAYDVLGVAYVLSGGPLDQFAEGERGLTLLGQSGSAWVYRRARLLPVARLVHAYEVIPDGADAINRIHSADFDPASTAILAVDPACPLGTMPKTADIVELLSHEPTRWRIRTVSDAPALLVLAENAYPGWRVTVDGVSVQSLTTYTSIRAVCLTAGEHNVEWTFFPGLYLVGGLVTVAAMGLALTAAFVLRRRPSHLGRQ